MGKHLVAVALALSLGSAAQFAFAADEAAPAEPFELPGEGNATVRLADFAGKVVLLNFFASWCGPCRQEMPILDRIHVRYAPLGFSVLGVNVDADGNAARALLDEVKVSFPVGFDAQSIVSDAYGVDAMPSTVMIDRAGNIRKLHRGYKPGYEDDYVAEIRALVKE